MGELPSVFPESQEKIPPGQTLLLAEPIFRDPGENESMKTSFSVPLGAEGWVQSLLENKPSGQTIEEGLANEYFSIAMALKEMNVSFRVIIAHRENIDKRFTLAILLHTEARGLALHEAISSTCFPRDMMVDFDGQVYVNREANFSFSDDSGFISPLGEGGRVLKLGKKVFVPDPRGFIKIRKRYTRDLRRLSGHFQFGFLPHPLSVEFDAKTGTKQVFSNDHLDRVAAFVKGKDGKDYLLLDSHYVDESWSPLGYYWSHIKAACQELDVSPEVVKRTPESIPYALNLEQFADGSILFTGGDDSLANRLGEIVGDDKIHATDRPIVFYPLYRSGGIRCMLLFAPQRLVGRPVSSHT